MDKIIKTTIIAEINLPKAAKKRGMEKIGLWADKMVNHFWFCCEKCDKNVEDLKVMMKLLFLRVHHLYRRCGSIL